MPFRVTPGRDGRGRLTGPNLVAPCALGAGGVIAAARKREGDGATPAGLWPFRRVLFRPDRVAPPPPILPSAMLHPEDGWCDDPADPAYNRQVRLPYAASAETLWRADALYDIIVVLGHNDDPVVPGAGSAIFLHIASPGFGPTRGCVAISFVAMRLLLASAQLGDALEVTL